jgi:predicted negative regulator of RcsB-dependent stress response
MSADKRPTKRSMKEDRLVSTTFKATEYVQKNQTPFIIGTLAIVVIFVAIMFFKWSGNRKKTESAALLSHAEMLGAVGQMDQYAAELQILADNYGGTSASKIATLRLADNYFSAKQYAQAEKYFNEVLDNYSSDIMAAASAAAGIGAVNEAKGNFAEAAKYYQRAADYKSGELWTPGYLLKAGQNFAKAGDKKSAQAAFDEINQKFATSSENNIAKRSLAELQN